MPEEDITLVQAREELKNQLAAGEYQTLVDAVLTGIGRLIQKMTRRSSPTRLRRYELKLFAANPSASEVISRLSSLLSQGVYLVAVYAALLTFLLASPGLLLIVGPFLLVWLWLPITAIFALNQTSLSSIIRRVKWKTLNGIQLPVEALQTAENYSSKETLDAVNRLLDYHDRVKATHDSALDLRAALNFLNSLLLPLLGFLLANLDRFLVWLKPPS